MRKTRKTRKEKIIADLRRMLQTQGDRVYKTKSLPQNTVVVIDNSYPYLISDLLKTLMLTASIIAFELLLLLAQKQNFFSLFRIAG